MLGVDFENDAVGCEEELAEGFGEVFLLGMCGQRAGSISSVAMASNKPRHQASAGSLSWLWRRMNAWYCSASSIALFETLTSNAKSLLRFREGFTKGFGAAGRYVGKTFVDRGYEAIALFKFLEAVKEPLVCAGILHRDSRTSVHGENHWGFGSLEAGNVRLRVAQEIGEGVDVFQVQSGSGGHEQSIRREFSAGYMTCGGMGASGCAGVGVWRVTATPLVSK
jgi:hypothetical protein